MILAATCATLAAMLAAVQGGETIHLEGDCGPVEIANVFPKRVTIDAERASVTGLSLTGRNITWRGGILTAQDGAMGAARRGYAVFVSGRDITVSYATITDARMGVVAEGATNLRLSFNRFWRLRSDGANVSHTVRFAFIGNTVSDSRPIAGDHADALQIRDRVTDATIEGNLISGPTQGLTQMDMAGDAPLARIVITGNRVAVRDYHAITLTACSGCRIERNTVRRGHPDRKAVIRAGEAVRCGNDAEDDRPDQPCG